MAHPLHLDLLGPTFISDAPTVLARPRAIGVGTNPVFFRNSTQDRRSTKLQRAQLALVTAGISVAVMADPLRSHVLIPVQHASVPGIFRRRLGTAVRVGANPIIERHPGCCRSRLLLSAQLVLPVIRFFRPLVARVADHLASDFLVVILRGTFRPGKTGVT